MVLRKVISLYAPDYTAPDTRSTDCFSVSFVNNLRGELYRFRVYRFQFEWWCNPLDPFKYLKVSWNSIEPNLTHQ